MGQTTGLVINLLEVSNEPAMNDRACTTYSLLPVLELKGQ